MIANLAKQLGISSDRIIKKAQEYERLIHLKLSGASGFHVKGISQLVICLDLAANSENINLDKDLCLQVSGLKKPSYNSSKQTLKQILGIDENISIKDISVQLGCPEISTNAENLLHLYKQQSCNGRTDIDHPGFKAAAIMASAKFAKIKVDRARLHEISGLKKTSFDKLVQQMITLEEQQHQKNEAKKKAMKRPQSFIEMVEAKSKAMDEEPSHGKEESESYHQVDFAAWKRKMLEEANLDP